METPESIRASLTQGMGFLSSHSDAYLHISIHPSQETSCGSLTNPNLPVHLRKMVLEGRLHMRLSVASHRELEVSSDLHPNDQSIQIFTNASNVRLGAHLDEDSVKCLWLNGEKRLHINVLEQKAVFLALRHFRI